MMDPWDWRYKHLHDFGENGQMNKVKWLSKYSHPMDSSGIYHGFIHPNGGFLGFLNHQQYLSIFLRGNCGDGN